MGTLWGRFKPVLRKAWAAYKTTVAIVVLIVLALTLLIFSNPIATWASAIAAAVLTVVKAVLSTIGTAAEADAQTRYDKVLAATPVDDLLRQGAADDLKKQTARKRSFEVASSTCGMFAVIFGVPAAASVGNALYPFSV